jgi:hypothetical protein
MNEINFLKVITAFPFVFVLRSRKFFLISRPLSTDVGPQGTQVLQRTQPTCLDAPVYP